MRLDLIQTRRPDLGARAQETPIPDFPTTWEDQFDAAFQEMFYNSNLLGEHNNKLAIVAPYADQFERIAGMSLDEAARTLHQRVPRGWSPPGLSRDPFDVFANHRAAVALHNEQHPDNPVPPFPSTEELDEAAHQRRMAIQGEADDTFSRPRSTGGAVASIGGNVAGGGVDPINILSLGTGAGATTGILRTALVEAGIGLGTQFGIESHGMATGWRQAGDPEYGLDDAALSVGMTGLTAGVLGGGLKAGGRGVSWLTGSARETLAKRAAGDPSVPPMTDAQARVIQDAANVLESVEDIEARNPLDATDAGAAAAHRAAMARAAQQTLFDEPVDVQDIVADAPRRRSPSAAVPDRVYTSAHRAIDTRMEVVEADTLIQASGDLQPRDRTRATSDAWVAETAARLEPDRLGHSPDASTGAPIVGPDQIIESGNGRVLAIRRAYADAGDSAAQYRTFAEQVDPAAGGMREPVVIRRRVSDLTDADRRAFVTEAQSSGTLRLSPVEQAQADARALRDADLGLLLHPDPGTAANRDFVRAFMDRIGTAEAAGLRTNKGNLSAAGHARIQAALTARAYDDAALVRTLYEDPDSNIRAIAGALQDVAGPWARMRSAVRRGDLDGAMDITDDLMAAVRLVAEARRTGQTIADLADQPTMFGGGLTPTARHLLNRMFRDKALKRPAGRKALAETLQGYLDDATQQTPGPRLFGRNLTPDEILTGRRVTRGEDAAPPETPPRPMTPGEAEAVVSRMEEPDHIKALETEVQRVLAENPEATFVDVSGEEGPLITKSVREILEHHAKERAAAREVATCVVGGGIGSTAAAKAAGAV